MSPTELAVSDLWIDRERWSSCGPRAYSFKELAMTFFPPGNRSKPGERHSYSPRHGIKGKREPRAGNTIERISHFSLIRGSSYVRDYLSKFYFIARNSNIKRKDRFIHLHRKRAKPGSHFTLLLFKSKEGSSNSLFQLFRLSPATSSPGLWNPKLNQLRGWLPSLCFSFKWGMIFVFILGFSNRIWGIPDVNLLNKGNIIITLKQRNSNKRNQINLMYESEFLVRNPANQLPF